jgi:hypothetical protein
MRFSLFGIVAMVILLYVGYKWGGMVFPKVGL